MKLPDVFHLDKSNCSSPASVMDVTGCKWPLDCMDKKGQWQTVFCNNPKQNNIRSSYCTHHARLAYHAR